MVAALADLRTGEVVDVEPLNAAVGALDTGVFNSDAMVLPAWLPAMLPYLPKKADGSLSTRVNYWVVAGTVESGRVDSVGSQGRPMSVDLRWPSLRAEGNAKVPALNDDRPGREFRLTVHRDTRGLKADAPKGLLLVHHQNRNGSRAQVVRVLVATTTRLTSSATSYRAGGRPTLRATVSPTAATGTVTFVEGRRVLGRAPVAKGTASIAAPALARGRHVVRAVYSGSGAYAASTSAAVTLSVS
jgi:hypothetical protein